MKKWEDENKIFSYIWIDFLIVDPQFKKNGVAKKLLSFAEEHCLKNGKKSLRLQTLSSPLNFNAIKLYENLGYQLKNIAFHKSRNFYFNLYEKYLLKSNL